MQKTERIKQWRQEEACAHIHGWDFSHIHDRYTEETDLPWDYEQILHHYVQPTDRLLDIDTGGGEFLLSLRHPYERTSCTENYPPNVSLCEQRLLPLGIDFHKASYDALPFASNRFDRIINRHGGMDVQELHRVLAHNGIFISEQVGKQNDRALIELLLPGSEPDFGGSDLKTQTQRFCSHGFHIVEAQEAFTPIRFYDVGALVWYARIIEWEFPGFCVDACLDRLWKAQHILETTGVIEGTIHRYLMVLQKGHI